MIKPVLFLLVSFPPFLLAQPQITVASGEWPPITGETTNSGGFCTHIAKEAFKLQGYQLRIDYYPWKRSYKSVKDGQHEVSLCWIKNEQRVKDVTFSKTPIMTMKKVLFHRIDHPIEWDSIKDLKNYTIGVTRGYSYGDSFDRMIQSMNNKKIQYANTDRQNFAKLLRERTEIFPLETIVGYTLLKKHFFKFQSKLITNHPKPLLSSDYFLIISKSIPHDRANKILDDFETGLSKLKATGRYHELGELSLTGYYE